MEIDQFYTAKERSFTTARKRCKAVACSGTYRTCQLRNSHLPPDHPDVRDKLRIDDHNSVYKSARYACTRRAKGNGTSVGTHDIFRSLTDCLGSCQYLV